ncbi:MAG TPA: LLM class F420-dependent oxidoreductase [Acidimicrobiales bacterium]|nr:LLM class F420-dependent oxidoreductase [Acidimicrobiales bacterium]
MKFGIMFANVVGGGDAETAVAMAQAAEEAGFESLWTVEHVVVPAGYESPYPYSTSGRMPGPETSPIPDPFIWLAYVAAATSTIHLGTGITILPQRNPLVTAKAVATLDRMSGGRVELGVGAGWLEEEFRALGVPFEQRGARLDEYIGALRALWSEERPSYHGEFVDFTDCFCQPQPIDGRVPIHIGGHTNRAARRAGELGDGFFPGSADPELLAGLLGTMRKVAAEHDRDADAIEVTTGGLPDVAAVERMAEMGIHRVVVPPMAFDADGIRRQLETFADDVISHL